MTPFERLARQQERDRQELEHLLEAVGQAALAETLGGMWQHVLGVRTVIVASGEAPNAHGLEAVAERLWKAALSRWVHPVTDWAWNKQHPDATAAQIERSWEKLAARMEWTIDLVVAAVVRLAGSTSKLSPDQRRSQVADVLSIDAVTASLLDEIHAVELDLLDPERGRTDTDAAFARRVRLQTNVFLLSASRARSIGFQVLARTADTDEAQRRYRELERESRRSAANVRRAETELSRHDEKLFYNPHMDPAELARLTTKLTKLNGTDSHGRETWRNSITRDARAVATGLLNSSILQHGIDEAKASGDPWIKRWAATHDTRTRPTHRLADGQVQPILTPFDVGGAALDHPADFDAPADEFWNCRCGMFVMSQATYDQLITDGALVAATMEEPMSSPALEDLPPLMWHGTIMQEGVYTGDRRYWESGSLRTQPLPMPIRFQREDWGGHTGAVVVANMDAARRFEGGIRAWGTFANGDNTPEVNEVASLMANRMLRGISVDGDDVLDSQFSVELDAQSNEYQKFSSMRLRSSTMVAIPAFDGAEIYLGPPPPEWLLEGEALSTEQNAPGVTRPIEEFSDDELMSMLADISSMPENLAEYWSHGEGAAKIGWGRSGDFSRCERQLAKYVSPGQVAGTCANLHHRALGVWPGQEASLKAPYLIASIDTSEDVTMEALWGTWEMTKDQFMPRELDGLTPLTIADDGSISGHIAGWETCHQGFSDMCVVPPHSKTGYALFHTGAVRLTDGSDLPVGKLTVGAGHADPNRLGVRGATAHYDNSATAVAVVRAAEDKWGIQVSGRVIPGTPVEKVEELRRSPISGDWRTYQSNLELVAALGVNSPGFPIPRAMVASVDGQQISLLHAGYVPRDLDAEVGELAARMYLLLVASLSARMERVSRMELDPVEYDARVASLATRMTSLNTEE